MSLSVLNIGIAKKMDKVIPKSTVVLLGSSSTANNGQGDQTPGQVSNYMNVYSKGYWSWANILLGQRFHVLYNAGVAGETTAQIMARVGTDVLPYNPGYCVVQCGANDVTSAVDYYVTTAALLAGLQTITNAGITVILLTITPTDGVGTDDNKLRTKLNNYIRAISRTVKNIILVDTCEAVINQVTSEPLTNTLLDGLHPSTQGAYLMGLKIYNVLKDIIPSIDVFAGTNVYDEANPFLNPYFLGDSSGVATSWSYFTTSPASTNVRRKVARENGLEWQEWENVGGGLCQGNFTQEASTGFTIGQKVSGYLEFEVDENVVGMDSFGVNLIAYNVAVELKQSRVMLIDASDTARFPTTPIKGIMYIPKFEIPSTTTKLYLSPYAKLLSGKIRFGRLRIIIED